MDPQRENAPMLKHEPNCVRPDTPGHVRARPDMLRTRGFAPVNGGGQAAGQVVNEFITDTCGKWTPDAGEGWADTTPRRAGTRRREKMGNAAKTGKTTRRIAGSGGQPAAGLRSRETW